MSNNNLKTNWESFRDEEFRKAVLILDKLGYTLDEKQVHISGERFITGGRKLVLIGKRNEDGQKVVIKISSNKKVADEIKEERKSRNLLSKIDFAYKTFAAPKEILFKKINGSTILITEFIEQEKNFLERDTKEQFFLALKALKTQEGAHVIASSHLRRIHKSLEIKKAQDYIKDYKNYQEEILSIHKDDKKIKELFLRGEEFLNKNSNIINLYSDFLVHWDFVPHNFRINNDTVYLLDHSSFQLGNKHESWARFVNFMTVHNPLLASYLIQYIKDNRSPEELLSLKLMRICRLAELIAYYSRTLDKLSGNILKLNGKRVELWTKVLDSVLDNKTIDAEYVKDYIRTRDLLRSQEEKERQVGLH